MANPEKYSPPDIAHNVLPAAEFPDGVKPPMGPFEAYIRKGGILHHTTLPNTSYEYSSEGVYGTQETLYGVGGRDGTYDNDPQKRANYRTWVMTLMSDAEMPGKSVAEKLALDAHLMGRETGDQLYFQIEDVARIAINAVKATLNTPKTEQAIRERVGLMNATSAYKALGRIRQAEAELLGYAKRYDIPLNDIGALLKTGTQYFQDAEEDPREYQTGEGSQDGMTRAFELLGELNALGIEYREADEEASILISRGSPEADKPYPDRATSVLI